MHPSHWEHTDWRRCFLSQQDHHLDGEYHGRGAISDNQVEAGGGNCCANLGITGGLRLRLVLSVVVHFNMEFFLQCGWTFFFRHKSKYVTVTLLSWMIIRSEKNNFRFLPHLSGNIPSGPGVDVPVPVQAESQAVHWDKVAWEPGGDTLGEASSHQLVSLWGGHGVSGTWGLWPVWAKEFCVWLRLVVRRTFLQHLWVGTLFN